ncbi:hypothetical protein EDB81DRAFT_837619 [Dactylonectria macrodidyma]|uniref:Uncharacterized protein n=1 Tax=Dactylonectria macrodidyma TaxID=307937 RepID=A0A9P9FQ96_9HYPO|nr:hypothetical protein EDB81DRAFT_837619 [Dactylonectria macrodidyma]
MPPLQPFVAAWSRGARCDDMLKTPEPTTEGDAQPPSPPRPRFRIKRRIVSNLNAPTQQFLASVAAADIPIPSIEEPRVLDEDMADGMYPMSHLSDMEDLPLTPHDDAERMFSPPKTPAPGLVPSLSPKQYPNWSIDSTLSSLESSPDYESSRPSTAHSTHTSTSLLSYFSMSSEELNQCVSPDTEPADPIAELSPAEDADKTIKAQPSAVSRGKLRRAPWTKPMSQHLWSTYMMYLQDPKVTPIRLGKSGIPPHGVCLRVAREAKRSWKGSKLKAMADPESGSTTPTGQSSGTFVQWPHTCAATRAHLRELCKVNARTSARNQQYLAPSPTPFGKSAVRFWNRRSAPARSPSVFSGQDMVMSLAVSTSDSMQLQGPLAQLTSSRPDPQTDLEPEELPPPPSYTEAFPPFPGHEPLESERAPLASPFTTRSYGPSSSSSLPSSFVIDSDLHRQSHTTGPRRALKSPVRLTRSRSTQKRRSKQPLLEPRRIKRPSLGSDLWVDPSSIGEGPSTGPLMPEFSSTSLDERDSLFVPRTNLQGLFGSLRPRSPQPRQPAMLGLPAEAPPRLGSPFSLTSSSHSFPNRLTHSSSIDMGTIRRPFNTVQQHADNGPVTRSSLTTRLAYIDERLKEFRSRGKPRRRSESPL